MKRVVLSSVALLLVATVPAQAAPPRYHITGGHPPTRAYPYMAYVSVDKQAGTIACGGTLIAARWVLTAGHCIADPTEGPTTVTPDKVRVVLGRTDLRNIPLGEVLPVSRLALDPQYGTFSNMTPKHDVAVLQLTTPVGAQQARLARPQDSGLWAPGAATTTIGYGLTSASGTPPQMLLETELAIAPDSECRATTPIELDTAVCAGQGDARGVCFGDSGSPLLSAGTDTVIGVTSFASCDGRLNGFGRAGADPLNAWIRSIVPQAEIDSNPVAPQPGDNVTLLSAARVPGGSYSTLRWDLDNDGAFDDASGQTVTRTLDSGNYPIGLEASDAAGDHEIRRVVLEVRPRTAIVLGAPVRVSEGDGIAVTLTSPGSGTGAISVLGSGLPPVPFAAGETTKVLVVHTTDNWRRGGSKTVSLQLAGPTGQLLVGQPATASVRVRDDDVIAFRGGRTLHARGGRVTLRVRVYKRSTVRFAITTRSGKVIAHGTRRLRHTGRAAVRLKLSRSARALVRRRHKLGILLQAAHGHDRLGPPLKRFVR
jgi:hypothetical protein